MKKGCLYGLGCLALVVLSPFWVPPALLALAIFLQLVAQVLRAI